MRNLQLEAAIWNLFTSVDFFESAAQECERIMEWFGTLAISRNVSNFGRNNQIYDKFKKRAQEFRRGAELARLGDYKMIWDVSDCIRGDVRGMMEQPLQSWMTETEYKEFSGTKINLLLAFASQITSALNNAMTGADSFFDSDQDSLGRSNDDDGFPGDEIVETYKSEIEWYEGQLRNRQVHRLPYRRRSTMDRRLVSGYRPGATQSHLRHQGYADAAGLSCSQNIRRARDQGQYVSFPGNGRRSHNLVSAHPLRQARCNEPRTAFESRRAVSQSRYLATDGARRGTTKLLGWRNDGRPQICIRHHGMAVDSRSISQQA
jgi:hypothetical protein